MGNVIGVLVPLAVTVVILLGFVTILLIRTTVRLAEIHATLIVGLAKLSSTKENEERQT